MQQIAYLRDESSVPARHAAPLKICLVTSFPPSRGDLNEYGFHLANALRKNPEVNLVLLADEIPSNKELDGFRIKRCWRFDSLLTSARLWKEIRKENPDVVWFNMGFSTFARAPLPAFLSIASPAISRASGFYTHVTLHTVFERINLKDAGIKIAAPYRLAGRVATRVLLRADDVSVLLPSFRSELIKHYDIDAGRVHFRPHGTFSVPAAPQTATLPQRELVVLAFGYWGTYKRLESVLEAWPHVTQEVPSARLWIGGLNHPSAPGYLEALRDQHADDASISFLGYVPEEELPSLFRKASLVVLPYSSAAGTSGVVHQACEYGLPLLATAIPEIQEVAREQGIAVEFYPPGDAEVLKFQLVRLLKSADLRRAMTVQNLSAGSNMQISQVVGGYLELFKARTQKRRKASIIGIHDYLSHLRLSRQIGNWLLHSGIEESNGGVARYHLAHERRNKPVSTEITGYCLSALVVLHKQTGEEKYWNSALKKAKFLAEAWNASLAAMPFEVEGEGSGYSYFFDAGIIVRGLLALWRRSAEPSLLSLAVQCGKAMAADFQAENQFHPIITLPDKQALPHERDRWSRSSGCYQLKAAMAWKELAEATGDDHFNNLYRGVLTFALETHLSFLPGIEDTLGVMDRLHAYSYFLEGLLPSLDEAECRHAMKIGIERLAQFARDIAPQFLRSDVLAQLLRVRIYADQAGVLPLDRESAEYEASLIQEFQSHDSDPRLNGGFWFGRKGDKLLTFMNPVSTVFCYQALDMLARHQGGERHFLWQDLI